MDLKRQEEIARALVVEYVREKGTAALSKGTAFMKKAGISDEEAEQFLRALAPDFLKRTPMIFAVKPKPDIGQIPISNVGGAAAAGSPAGGSAWPR